jgi:16S rRNA C967 or C1407 C5-methylase (RsmB/RsmF family)
VIEKALASNSCFRLIDCGSELNQLRAQRELEWQDIASLTQGPYLQSIPGVHPCDGFFAAILQRS